jgi:hypothetical protein
VELGPTRSKRQLIAVERDVQLAPRLASWEEVWGWLAQECARRVDHRAQREKAPVVETGAEGELRDDGAQPSSSV